MAPSSGTSDFDADGAERILCRPPREYGRRCCEPSDGGTLGALDFRPIAVTLINSMQRRPEAYHDRLREAASPPSSAVASIHDQVRSRKPGLERFLRYDPLAAHAFRS